MANETSPLGLTRNEASLVAEMRTAANANIRGSTREQRLEALISLRVSNGGFSSPEIDAAIGKLPASIRTDAQVARNRVYAQICDYVTPNKSEQGEVCRNLTGGDYAQNPRVAQLIAQEKALEEAKPNPRVHSAPILGGAGGVSASGGGGPQGGTVGTQGGS